MTNIERAADILKTLHAQDQLEGDGVVGCFDATAAAQALADAGLLAPDPAPTRTLADELRDEVREHPEYSQSMYRLAALADRVETLEQERDEAQDMEGRATANLSIQMDRAERLSEELAEARVSAEEQAAEIARLQAREIPDGWRIADHPEYGTVIAAERPDKDGYTNYARLEKGLNDLVHCGWAHSSTLSFRDEAPEPQQEQEGTPEQEQEYIDPKTCDRFTGYLIENGISQWHGVRRYPTGPYQWRCERYVDGDAIYHVATDDTVTVLRPLTLEEIFDEMDELHNEAPEPQQEQEETPEQEQQQEHIDPASCGKYRPYLVEIAGKEYVAVREDGCILPWANRTSNAYDLHLDKEVKVIRPLTSEEMDAQ